MIVLPSAATLICSPEADPRGGPGPLDPKKILGTLVEHAVEYVLIGALAPRLHGFPRLTAGWDLAPAADVEKVERLAGALRVLGARIFTEGVPEGLEFDCTAGTLLRAEIWSLMTRAGRIDVVFLPSGSEEFEDLVRKAVSFEAFGVRFRVSSLEDILRSKEAADRPRDRQDAAVLREMIRRKA